MLPPMILLSSELLTEHKAKLTLDDLKLFRQSGNRDIILMPPIVNAAAFVDGRWQLIFPGTTEGLHTAVQSGKPEVGGTDSYALREWELRSLERSGNPPETWLDRPPQL